MNDKKKHLRRCFRIAVHEYKHFTTITSDEQYFLNEKAVCVWTDFSLEESYFLFFSLYLPHNRRRTMRDNER